MCTHRAGAIRKRMSCVACKILDTHVFTKRSRVSSWYEEVFTLMKICPRKKAPPRKCDGGGNKTQNRKPTKAMNDKGYSPAHTHTPQEMLSNKFLFGNCREIIFPEETQEKKSSPKILTATFCQPGRFLE